MTTQVLSEPSGRHSRSDRSRRSGRAAAILVLAATLVALGAGAAEARADEPKDLYRPHKLKATWTLIDHDFDDPLITNGWNARGKPFGKGRVMTVNEPVDTGVEKIHFFGKDRHGTYTGVITMQVTELSEDEVAPGVFVTTTGSTGKGEFDEFNKELNKKSKGRYRNLEKGRFHIVGGGSCTTNHNTGTKECSAELTLNGVVFF